MAAQKPTIASLPKNDQNFMSPQPAKREPAKPSFRSPADILPLIKRGITGMIDDEEESIVSMGWKTEVTSRKEREESLR